MIRIVLGIKECNWKYILFISSSVLAVGFVNKSLRIFRLLAFPRLFFGHEINN